MSPNVSYQPTRLRGAVLDFSGTIVDPGVYAPAVVFQDVFKRFLVPISMEEARKPMGNHKKVHIQRITEDPEVRERWKQHYERYPDEKDVADMFEEFVPAQLKVLPQYANFIPGALDACLVMRSEYKLQLGNTTGFTRSMVDLIVHAMKKNGNGFRLDYTVAADEVEHPRPAKDACLKNMELMGIEDASEMVKIGDTEMDMAEGRDARMWSIGLSRYSNLMGMLPEELEEFEARDPKGYTDKMADTKEKLYQAGAHFVVDDIVDSLPLLKVINHRLAKGETPDNQIPNFLL
jgi:phosphonoacetaldehyde hydrolase